VKRLEQDHPACLNETDVPLNKIGTVLEQDRLGLNRNHGRLEHDQRDLLAGLNTVQRP